MTDSLPELARKLKVLASKPQWLCEFCYMRAYTASLPSSWEWVWQSAVCPDCQAKVAENGGYGVVKGGAYAEIPDPRPWPALADATVTRLAEAVLLLDELSLTCDPDYEGELCQRARRLLAPPSQEVRG